MRTFFISLLVYVSCSLSLYSQSSSFRAVPANIWYDSEKNRTEQEQNSPSNKKRVSETSVSAPQDSAVFLNFHNVKTFNEEVTPIKSEYDISRSARLTVIVVFHSPDTNTEHGIWSVVRDGKQVTGLTDKRLLRPNSEYNYPVKRRGIPLINTSMQAFSKIKGKADSNHFVLGEAILKDSSVSSFNGDIAECLVFDRFLKKPEALKIETYLAIKYGITLIESDYISPFDVVLWNYEENKNYSNGIAGIGKDSVFGLEQKQGSSSEEEDLLTIGIGNFTDLNRDNNSVLKEGNYLVWGHDNGELTYDNLGNATLYPLLERKWLIQNTKTDKKQVPTTVKFQLQERDTSNTSAIYYLAIDRSGMGNFTSHGIEYFAHDSIDTLGFVYFHNIVWDVDGSGKDMFTFSAPIPQEEEEEEELAEMPFSDKRKSADNSNNNNSSDEIMENDFYKLYPNPTTGRYKLEATFPEIADIFVKVYNMQGSLLEEWQSSGNQYYSFERYLSTQGNYNIEVESSFGKKGFKVVVAR